MARRAAAVEDRGRRIGGQPGPRRRPKAGPAAAKELERLIHERSRLGILSALAVNEALSFNEIKGLLGLSDGSLSVHARKLEEAGYLACSKTFAGRLPHTEYRLTASGRRALQEYLEHMEALIRAVKDV